MLQEDAQVGWDPVAINYHLPWQSKLLVVYLVFVSVWTLAKMIWVFRQTFRDPIPRKLQVCEAELQFVRRWVVLTVLLAIAACADIAAGFSAQISMSKAVGAGLLAAYLQEVFSVLGIAMVTSAVLYVLAMWCETRVHKQLMRT